MAGFLDNLARRLVPECDPEVVRSIFETASAGYAGARTRDGRRASVLTPSGTPFEASVTGANGRPDRALRYVTETASGMPFFAPRLAAQRTALDRLVEWLPGGGPSLRDELQSFVDVVFPDPAAVPARTRFATFFGIVHRPDVPGGLAGLKVYGNLADDISGLQRLAEGSLEFADLLSVLTDVPSLVPRLAALEVHGSGQRRYKLYVRAPDVAGVAAVAAAHRNGVEAGDLPTELARRNVEVKEWSRALFCCEARNGSELRLSAHLPAKALGLDPAGLATVARSLARDHHGTTDVIDALPAAAATGVWQHTVLGLGLPPARGLGKLNVYFAPGKAPAQSGWN